MKKYKVLSQTYIYNDGWLVQGTPVVQKTFDSRSKAEKEYGKFYNRLPKGSCGKSIDVLVLWRLEVDGETHDEVVGYIIK